MKVIRSQVDPAPSRSGMLADALFAVGLAAFVTFATYFASHGQSGRRPFDLGAVALLLLAGGALAARRLHPVATLATVFVAVLAYQAIGYAQGPIWLTLIVAYTTAVVRGYAVVAAGFAITGFLVFPWLDRVVRGAPAPTVASLAALAAWLIVLLGVAEAIRIQRERRAEAARMAEQEALRRASEERLRIARELHDALGHHLSLISVQAGVALHVHDELPEPVTASLSAIKQASKEALTELRSVLEILRQDGELAPRSPMSTLERLDDLVAQASVAGLDVRVEIEGDSRALPFGVDVAGFRIVQESLTNVARHAGGSATATVRLAYGDHDLTVQVDDEGPADGASAAPASPAGSGNGLTGMRERVSALSGDLEAGPRPGGGFRVRARLPFDHVDRTVRREPVG